MTLYPFYAAAAHLKEFYDIVLDDVSFENIGLHAWDKIGNKRTRLYRYSGKVINGELPLPCNADIIEAVTSDNVDFTRTDNVQSFNYNNYILEDYIEGFKVNKNASYTKGKLINYELDENNVLHITGYDSANVLYKGVLADEDGLPSLNFKEVEAIATYCAYVTLNKKAMITKDQVLAQFAQLLKKDWVVAKGNARTPEYLNENEMNAILDVKNSWDRKRYGVSYKAYR